MFSTIAFGLVGVICLLFALFDLFSGASKSTLSTTMDFILIGVAVQCFIGAELSSIWRRTAEATEASTEALKVQTKLLQMLTATMPNVAVAAAAQEGGEQG